MSDIRSLSDISGGKIDLRRRKTHSSLPPQSMFLNAVTAMGETSSSVKKMWNKGLKVHVIVDFLFIR